MPETFVHLTGVGQIETEVDMNDVEGWTSISYTERKAAVSQSFGGSGIAASIESSASDRSDKINTQKGFNPVHLDNYLKRKCEEEDDAIECTPAIKKRQRHVR